MLQLLTGLSAGMVLFLIAAGMSIIFGTLRIINLAHGSIYMLGTFLCFWLTSSFAHIPGVFWWALFFAPLGIALLGGLIEIFLLRRIYGEHELYTFILTFGLILILGDICKLIWGVAYHTVSAPWPVNRRAVHSGNVFPDLWLVPYRLRSCCFHRLNGFNALYRIGEDDPSCHLQPGSGKFLRDQCSEGLYWGFYAGVLAGGFGWDLDATHVRCCPWD